MKRLRRHTIKAVHELDLQQYLEGLGLWEALISGSLACSICSARLNETNLGCIYPEGDEIRVCCEKVGCLQRVRTEGRA